MNTIQHCLILKSGTQFDITQIEFDCIKNMLNQMENKKNIGKEADVWMHLKNKIVLYKEIAAIV